MPKSPFGAPDSLTRSARITPGFEIEGDQVLLDRRRPNFDPAQVRREFAAEIFRANRYGTIALSQLEELAALIQAKIDRFPRYFASCPFDYSYAFTFREGPGAIVVRKSGNRVQAHLESASGATLEVLTRLASLRYALETRYGHEILFVGSGVRFRYRSRNAIRTPVHREAMALLRPMREDRTRRAPRMVDDLKAVARQALQKAGLRRTQPDLYALEEWLVPRT